MDNFCLLFSHILSFSCRFITRIAGLCFCWFSKPFCHWYQLNNIKLAGRHDYSELQKPTERKRAGSLDIICECKATEIANILETVNSLKQLGHWDTLKDYLALRCKSLCLENSRQLHCFNSLILASTAITELTFQRAPFCLPYVLRVFFIRTLRVHVFCYHSSVYNYLVVSKVTLSLYNQIHFSTIFIHSS